MNKGELIAVVAAIVGLGLPELLAESDSDMKLRRAVEFGGILEVDPRTVREAEKAEMRATLREYRDKWIGNDPSLARMYDDALVRLGDVELTGTYATERIDVDPIGAGDALIRSGNPDVILLLGPILFRDEKYEVAPGDLPITNPSHHVARGVIPQLLANTPAFNAAVTNWARDFFDPHRNPVFYDDPDAARQMIRDWWKENEARFRARDFKNVTPGRLAIPANATAPEMDKAVEPPKLRPVIPPAAAPAQSHPRRETWYPEAAILALVASLAVWLIRRHLGGKGKR